MDIATSRVTLDSFKGMTFYLCYQVAKKTSSDFKMYPVFSRSKMDFCLNEEPLFSSPENEYSELPSKLAYFIDFYNCYIIFDRLHSFRRNENSVGMFCNNSVSHNFTCSCST